MKLREFQSEALLALRKSKAHVICVAPTGSGKSLIYERMAARRGMRTLLVTPLVALARQQAARLEEAGVEVLLGSGGGDDPDRPVPNPSDRISAWIVSPETLLFPHRRAALRRWKPGFLVVDECHCLWDWGEDFRPAFTLLPDLIEECAIPRSLWLTATLPFEAREKLRSRLPEPVIELGGFDLPANIHLACVRAPWPSRAEALLDWVSRQDGQGIVFAQTREGTERVARLLEAAGKTALSYHAGLSREERRSIEAQVAARIPDVVVATSAFGMGMDFPHLRWAALWQAPPSLLSLAQAVGRVGRGRERGRALVLWDDEDFRLLEWAVQRSGQRRLDLLSVRDYLRGGGCRRVALADYFEGARSALGASCGDMCSTCGA